MAKYRIVPERSRLWVEARSSLHPIRFDTDGLTGRVEADVTDGRVQPEAGSRLELPADRLRTGNPLYDGELERRLEVRKFPRIVGDVRAVSREPSGHRFRLVGDLTLHGVTREVDGEVVARAVGDRTIEVEGERVFDMREFGLEPPRILMLRVHPDVRVRAHVVAERED